MTPEQFEQAVREAYDEGYYAAWQDEGHYQQGNRKPKTEDQTVAWLTEKYAT